MKGNEFLDKLELIDTAYIAAADAKPVRKNKTWPKWCAAAACFCLIAAGAAAIAGVWDVSALLRPTSSNVDLPLVSIPELSDTGFGFEGYLCHDSSELYNGNPWNEDMSIITLPVYRNGAYDASGAGVPLGMSEDEMLELANSTACALGLEIDEVQIVANTIAYSTDQAAVALEVTTDGGTISVWANGTVEYLLSERESEIFGNEASADLSRVIEAYDELLSFENPCAIACVEYNSLGELNCSYFAYDSGAGELEKILNYNFCAAQFLFSEDGELLCISINNGLTAAEKIGDYPIIGTGEATKRLLAGKYRTSASAKFPGKKYIAKVELVYRSGSSDEVLLPYYRFYVELPDSVNQSAEKNGLKTYAAYYVPAIADEYIADMPVYDGRFN